MNINEAYSKLQLEVGATLDDVKCSFRKLCKQYHPDGGQGDSDKFRELTAARNMVEADIKVLKLQNNNSSKTYVVKLEDFISYRGSSIMKVMSGAIVEKKQFYNGDIYILFDTKVYVHILNDKTGRTDEYTNELTDEYTVRGGYNLTFQINIDGHDVMAEKEVSVEILGVKSTMTIKNIGCYFIKVADMNIKVTVSFKPLTVE